MNTKLNRTEKVNLVIQLGSNNPQATIRMISLLSDAPNSLILNRLRQKRLTQSTPKKRLIKVNPATR